MIYTYTVKIIVYCTTIKGFNNTQYSHLAQMNGVSQNTHLQASRASWNDCPQRLQSATCIFSGANGELHPRNQTYLPFPPLPLSSWLLLQALKYPNHLTKPLRVHPQLRFKVRIYPTTFSMLASPSLCRPSHNWRKIPSRLLSVQYLFFSWKANKETSIWSIWDCWPCQLQPDEASLFR